MKTREKTNERGGTTRKIFFQTDLCSTMNIRLWPIFHENKHVSAQHASTQNQNSPLCHSKKARISVIVCGFLRSNGDDSCCLRGAATNWARTYAHIAVIPRGEKRSKQCAPRCTTRYYVYCWHCSFPALSRRLLQELWSSACTSGQSDGVLPNATESLWTTRLWSTRQVKVDILLFELSISQNTWQIPRHSLRWPRSSPTSRNATRSSECWRSSRSCQPVCQSARLLSTTVTRYFLPDHYVPCHSVKWLFASRSVFHGILFSPDKLELDNISSNRKLHTLFSNVEWTSHVHRVTVAKTEVDWGVVWNLIILRPSSARPKSEWAKVEKRDCREVVQV